MVGAVRPADWVWSHANYRLSNSGHERGVSGENAVLLLSDSANGAE